MSSGPSKPIELGGFSFQPQMKWTGGVEYKLTATPRVQLLGEFPGLKIGNTRSLNDIVKHVLGGQSSRTLSSGLKFPSKESFEEFKKNLQALKEAGRTLQAGNNRFSLTQKVLTWLGKQEWLGGYDRDQRLAKFEDTLKSSQQPQASPQRPATGGLPPVPPPPANPRPPEPPELKRSSVPPGSAAATSHNGVPAGSPQPSAPQPKRAPPPPKPSSSNAAATVSSTPPATGPARSPQPPALPPPPPPSSSGTAVPSSAPEGVALTSAPSSPPMMQIKIQPGSYTIMKDGKSIPITISHPVCKVVFPNKVEILVVSEADHNTFIHSAHGDAFGFSHGPLSSKYPSLAQSIRLPEGLSEPLYYMAKIPFELSQCSGYQHEPLERFNVDGYQINAIPVLSESLQKEKMLTDTTKETAVKWRYEYDPTTNPKPGRLQTVHVLRTCAGLLSDTYEKEGSRDIPCITSAFFLTNFNRLDTEKSPETLTTMFAALERMGIGAYHALQQHQIVFATWLNSQSGTHEYLTMAKFRELLEDESWKTQFLAILKAAAIETNTFGGPECAGNIEHWGALYRGFLATDYRESRLPQRS